MVGATFGAAALFALIGLILRPGAAIGIVIMTIMLWPSYLHIPVGLASMSAARIVALILLVRLLIAGRGKQTPLCRADWYVILGWAWTVIACVLAGWEFDTIKEMIGRFFDTVLMYLVARYSLQSTEDAKALFLPVAVTAVIMGVVGIVESTTGFTPYSGFERFIAWEFYSKGQEYRYGFLRAKGSASVHIYFGLAMVIIGGILWAARSFAGTKFWATLILGNALLGALSSMSSGPWLACASLLIFNWYSFHPKYIKPTLWFLLFAAIAIEFASNRHFYNLIDYFALNTLTAWYRTRLLEVAIAHWYEFWLVGVGYFPHHWADTLDQRGHIDIVNHYLIVGVYGGFRGIYLYVASHVHAIKLMLASARKTDSVQYKSLLFGLTTTLLAVDFTSMSVSLYGPPLLLSFILLGLLVSASLQLSEEQQESSEKNPEAEIPWYEEKW